MPVNTNPTLNNAEETMDFKQPNEFDLVIDMGVDHDAIPAPEEFDDPPHRQLHEMLNGEFSVFQFLGCILTLT
jgi:hypothetical protein